LRDVILNDLNDTLLKPTTTQEVAALPPFQRKKFVTGDILLCAFLESKLFDRAQNKISACPTAYDKWNRLEETYAKSSVTAQNLLTEQWNNLRQSGAQSIEQFIEKIDFMSMEMAAAGIPPTAQAKLYTLLSGASKEWSTEIKILKRTHADYQAACDTLTEAGIEKEGAQAEQAERAFAARGNAQSRGGYRGRGRGGPPACYTCGGEGHTSWNCPSGLKPTKDRTGRSIPRCYNCLGEGHRYSECPDDQKRRWGTFTREEVVASAGGGPSTQGTASTTETPRSLA
jgi:hypothetical protein